MHQKADNHLEDDNENHLEDDSEHHFEDGRTKESRSDKLLRFLTEEPSLEKSLLLAKLLCLTSKFDLY